MKTGGTNAVSLFPASPPIVTDQIPPRGAAPASPCFPMFCPALFPCGTFWINQGA